MMTIYKLSWGGGGNPNQHRYFNAQYATDAAVRFSERVLEFDRDPNISAAWVHLERRPDSVYPEGMYLLAWTKTSDERPTKHGAIMEADAIAGLT